MMLRGLLRGYGASALTVVVGISTLAAGCTVPDAEQTGVTAKALSPLEEYIGLAWDGMSSAEMERFYEERSLQQSELVAQCMREAGFEFVPGAGTAIIGRSPVAVNNDLEWVTQWGYGITDSPDGPLITWVEYRPDPNESILNELTSGERAAWEQALRGEFAGLVGVMPSDVPLANQGCQGWAQIQMDAEPITHRFQLWQTDEWAPLGAAIADMRLGVDQSDAVTQAHFDWANCMADAGYLDFERQPDAFLSITEAYGRIPRLADGALPIQGQMLLEQLQEQEIELALADLNCRVSTNFLDRIDEATIAAETQFVTDNRATLEAFRNAFEQQDN